jgi:hypothetical protein
MTWGEFKTGNKGCRRTVGRLQIVSPERPLISQFNLQMDSSDQSSQCQEVVLNIIKTSSARTRRTNAQSSRNREAGQRGILAVCTRRGEEKCLAGLYILIGAVIPNRGPGCLHDSGLERAVSCGVPFCCSDELEEQLRHSRSALTPTSRASTSLETSVSRRRK